MLDRILRGGLPTGRLAEIAGEASCGKTQICLQLLLQAQLPQALGGLGGSALYISTEHELPKERLEQIATSRPSMATHFVNVSPLTHLYVEKVDGADRLGFVIRKLPDLVEQARCAQLRTGMKMSAADAMPLCAEGWTSVRFDL